MNGVIFPYVIPFFLHVDTVNLTIYASKKALNLEVLDCKDSEIIQLVHNRALFRFQRHASSFAM